MEEKKYFFDKPENLKRFFRIFYGIIAFLVILDVAFPLLFGHKHADFAWESWPGFYAVFGFVAFVILVFGAKYILRPLAKRREDYYD